MGITPITWEEFETYKTVKTPDNLYIREHDGKYYTVFELGIASVRRIFEIQTDDLKEYLNGQRSADDILFKAQNDAWPLTEEEKVKHRKEKIKKHPMTLISNPNSREIFSLEELKYLIPIAEEKYIASYGSLPDDYVSALN